MDRDRACGARQLTEEFVVRRSQLLDNHQRMLQWLSLITRHHNLHLGPKATAAQKQKQSYKQIQAIAHR